MLRCPRWGMGTGHSVNGRTKGTPLSARQVQTWIRRQQQSASSTNDQCGYEWDTTGMHEFTRINFKHLSTLVASRANAPMGRWIYKSTPAQSAVQRSWQRAKDFMNRSTVVTWAKQLVHGLVLYKVPPPVDDKQLHHQQSWGKTGRNLLYTKRVLYRNHWDNDPSDIPNIWKIEGKNSQANLACLNLVNVWTLTLSWRRFGNGQELKLVKLT